MHLHAHRCTGSSSYIKEKIKPLGHGLYSAALHRIALRSYTVHHRLSIFLLIETTRGLYVIKKEFQDNPDCRLGRLIGLVWC